MQLLQESSQPLPIQHRNTAVGEQHDASLRQQRGVRCAAVRDPCSCPTHHCRAFVHALQEALRNLPWRAVGILALHHGATLVGGQPAACMAAPRAVLRKSLPVHNAPCLPPRLSATHRCKEHCVW